MRTLRLFPILAVLTVLAACSEPVQPAGELFGPSEASFDIGTYIGTGTSKPDTVLFSPSQEPIKGSRGGGYIGGGH